MVEQEIPAFKFALVTSEVWVTWHSHSEGRKYWGHSPIIVDCLKVWAFTDTGEPVVFSTEFGRLVPLSRLDETSQIVEETTELHTSEAEANKWCDDSQKRQDLIFQRAQAAASVNPFLPVAK